MDIESTNKNNDNIQIENEINTDNNIIIINNNNNNNKNNTDNNPIKCIFKKPTKQRNIRKRSDDLILNTTTSNNLDEDDDKDDNEEKDKKKLKSKINQYTTKQDKKNEFSYDSSGNAGSSINSAELSSTQYMNEEEEFQKEVVLSSRKNNNDINNNENSSDDGIYRGMKSYSTFVEKKSDLTYKGGGVKAGPMKTSTTYKLSNRIDHQPDVCKDYKQTGQCTFGDACKFLHDRSDYKSGWQIDKEYEEEQKQKRLNNINGIKNNDKKDNSGNDDNEQQLPFACFICKKQYTDPVQTKCKHFFCEECALTHNRKNKKCALCGEPTLGTFITPPKKILDQLMEISKSHFKNQS
ncbi:hypothetical protein ACTFIV_001321 [Dictyostelium citrinum]